MKNKTTLYIATHNKTGLKYFGKSNKYFTQVDLQKYYHGSGTGWKQHLKEYGDDVTMEIFGIFGDKEVMKQGKIFSENNKIVESTLWANRVIETGGGKNSTNNKSYLKVNPEYKELSANDLIFRIKIAEYILTLDTNSKEHYIDDALKYMAKDLIILAEEKYIL